MRLTLHFKRLPMLGLILILVPVFASRTAQAQAVPSGCPHRLPKVYIVPETLCIEVILDQLPTNGMLGIAGLTFTPDGTLYYASPATNAIWKADLDPSAPYPNLYYQAPQPFAVNLPEPPHGLTYDAVTQAWFASSDSMIVRLTDIDQDGTADTLQIIVQGLPKRVGGWLGNVRIGPDRRLYVAKAGQCDTCSPQDPRQGALLSFALDGSDIRIVATGLRNAFDMTWLPDGRLLVGDGERADHPAELNIIDLTKISIPDFGWPQCAAPDNVCAGVTPPLVRWPISSNPAGLVYYDQPAIPELRGLVIAVLAGSWNTPTLNGYEITGLRLHEGDRVDIAPIVPRSQRTTSDAALIWTGLYPYHPYGIAIGPDGWLYISVQEGRLYRLRPYPNAP